MNVKISIIMIRKISIALFICLLAPTAFTQTTGTLKVSVTTAGTGLAGKNYYPQNIIAIWVEDASGKFVKTLLAQAQMRRMHLSKWMASTKAAGSTFDMTDAVSGATNRNHATRVCTWDGTDAKGNTVADGTYKICMELTDIDAPGNYASFTVTKGPKADKQTPANQKSFTAISLEWVPGTVVTSGR